MAVKDDFRSLSGPSKAAIMLLALGQDYAAKVFTFLDDDEIRELSQAMSSLGSVNAKVVERLFVEFANQMSSGGSVIGNVEATQRLLASIMDPDRVQSIMDDITGPAGRTMWD
jgi:flagellar motor switch protein FliG